MIELSTPSTGTNGRVALVTGAARGIGLGISAWLISEGWQVVLTDLDRVRGSKVAKVLGDNAWFIAMDVSNEGQVALGVAEVLGQFGRLDALVCNAAIGAGGRCGQLDHKAANPRARSACRSATSSRPTAMRIRLSRMPAASRSCGARRP